MYLAEFDVAQGLVVIIAFLIGMGTPYPHRGGRKERRNGTPDRRAYAPVRQLERIAELLELLTTTPRAADRNEPEEPGGGQP